MQKEFFNEMRYSTTGTVFPNMGDVNFALPKRQENR